MIDATVTEAAPQTNAETPAVINISTILTDLDNGIDRDGISAKYSLTKAEVKYMFQHPALKGKRAKKKPTMRFQLVDDVTDVTLQPEPTHALETTQEMASSTSDELMHTQDIVSENANEEDTTSSGYDVTDLY